MNKERERSRDRKKVTESVGEGWVGDITRDVEKNGKDRRERR